jgi:two-component sensor histidine kinase
MTVNVRLKPVAADNLALAIVAASDQPALLLDEELGVIEASASFCQAFQIEPASLRGAPVFSLGDGEWDRAELRSLLASASSNASGRDACEMDLKPRGRAPRSLVLRAHALGRGEEVKGRMLLTVTDVTDARLTEKLKDDLIQEKAVLLREFQHRVGNSLQIIAGVLLQSARKVGGGEAGDYLYDAHNRVMSVAALQRHLAVSSLGNAQLRTYFTSLCESICASMIGEGSPVSLSVSTDDSTCTADVSVRLGLIMTELVINALKHAFPDGRGGRISVDYASDGANWTLTVADDGIGMDGRPGMLRPGIGTNIVEALAKQLNAAVRVSDNKPGARISVVHGTAGDASQTEFRQAV